MTHTKKNAPQVAQVEKNANANAEQKNTRANNKERVKEAKEVKEAQEKARQAKAQAKARQDRAAGVVSRIKAEAATLSGVLRSVWLRATEITPGDDIAEADALAIKDDFKAVTGQEWPATRREFAQAWIEAVHKYTKATEKGQAVSTKSLAGYMWVVPFRVTYNSVWTEIVGGWAKQRTPMALLSSYYYTKDKNGQAIKAKASEAVQAIEEAKAIAEAVAEAKAKEGERVRQEWASGKAQAKA